MEMRKTMGVGGIELTRRRRAVKRASVTRGMKVRKDPVRKRKDRGVLSRVEWVMNWRGGFLVVET